MSVVIVGGHDRMVQPVRENSANHLTVKAKVFYTDDGGFRQTDRSAGSACTLYKHRFPIK